MDLMWAAGLVCKLCCGGAAMWVPKSLLACMWVCICTCLRVRCAIWTAGGWLCQWAPDVIRQAASSGSTAGSGPLS